jgi:hypothetical protein
VSCVEEYFLSRAISSKDGDGLDLLSRGVFFENAAGHIEDINAERGGDSCDGGEERSCGRCIARGSRFDGLGDVDGLPLTGHGWQGYWRRRRLR